MATKRWIFMLDADEELDTASAESLRRIAQLPADKTALYVKCNNLSDDYKGTGAISHLIARIFPNSPRVRFLSPVHEYVTYDGKEMGIESRLSDVEITHHGYLKDVVAGRNKAERNFALIRRATETEPNNAFHWYNLGMTAHVVQDYEQAIASFEKMRAILKGAPRAFLPQSLVTLAECYLDARNDDKQALFIIEEALAASPHSSNAFFTKGRILAKAGRVSESREAFTAAIEAQEYRHIQFIVDDQIYRWKSQHCLGVSYAQEARWDEALEWYDRGLANQPNVQPLILNRAHALEGAERYDEAQTAFENAYEQFDDEPSLVQYINYLLRRRNYSAAMALMEQNADNVSKRTAATFMVGAAQIAAKSGDKNAELIYLRRANASDPAAGPVLDALEVFYKTAGDQSALDALYEEEMRHPPVEPPDYIRRSFRLLALKRFDDALEVAQGGLKKSPTDSELRYNSAVARVQLGDISGALRDLEVVSKDGSEFGQKTALLSSTLLRDSGECEAALRALEIAFGDAPTVEAALIRSQCLERLGKIDEAARGLERVSQMDRQRVGVEIASIYMRAGRFSEAQEAADRALA